MNDAVSGFVPGERLRLEGAGAGPLEGLEFAAKDIFDIIGHVSGGGNPDWASTQKPAAATAPVVQKLLDAGATLNGKTMTDELTRGILGTNVHYGTPLNPNAPDRLPGGSSSGSASVVAGAEVDFAIGSDTGGSVRIPASYCGIYGIRPTHGRVPLDGALGQSPSYDTIGWFARDFRLLARIGSVLLEAETTAPPPAKLIVADDAFALADEAVASAVAPLLAAAGEIAGQTERVSVCEGDIMEWRNAMAVLHQFEAHQTFADWIDEVNPRFAYDTARRFFNAAAITPAEVEASESVRQAHRARLAALLAPGIFIALPTAPGVAPLRAMRQSEMQSAREGITVLTCIAGGAGLPQVTIPAATGEGPPVGFSLIGLAGADEALLAMAGDIAEAVEQR